MNMFKQTKGEMFNMFNKVASEEIDSGFSNDFDVNRNLQLSYKRN